MGQGIEPGLLALVMDLEAEAEGHATASEAVPCSDNIGLLVRQATQLGCSVVLYDAADRLRKALGMEPRVPLLNLTSTKED